MLNTQGRKLLANLSKVTAKRIFMVSHIGFLPDISGHILSYNTRKCACRHLISPTVAHFVLVLLRHYLVGIIIIMVGVYPQYREFLWVSRHRDSPAPWLFIQLFLRADIKGNIKGPHHWPFCEMNPPVTDNSPHNVLVMRKAFPCHDVIILERFLNM